MRRTPPRSFIPSAPRSVLRLRAGAKLFQKDLRERREMLVSSGGGGGVLQLLTREAEAPGFPFTAF